MLTCPALRCFTIHPSNRNQTRLTFTLCMLIRFPQLSKYCLRSLSYKKDMDGWTLTLCVCVCVCTRDTHTRTHVCVCLILLSTVKSNPSVPQQRGEGGEERVLWLSPRARTHHSKLLIIVRFTRRNIKIVMTKMWVHSAYLPLPWSEPADSTAA